MNVIFDYNRTLFDPDTGALYPGILDMLASISQKHQLFLVSRNEPSRHAEIARLDIKHYFQKVFFVEEKTPELFAGISDNAEKTIIVGDSIRDEITIGNMLGLITIRILQGTFASEIPAHPIQIATYEINDMRNIQSIVERYE